MSRSPVAPVTVRRGEVWWVTLEPARGSEIRKARPAVVLTTDALNRARHTVMVVPLSTGRTPRPPIVIATPSAGEGSVAVCDQVRAIDKGRLTRRDGQLALADLPRSGAASELCWSCRAVLPWCRPSILRRGLSRLAKPIARYDGRGRPAGSLTPATLSVHGRVQFLGSR